MTCIVGMVFDDKKSGKSVYIGADSAGVECNRLLIDSRRHSKVFFKKRKTGPSMLLGYTSSFRMGQILEYDVMLPKDNLKLTPLRWMVKMFIPAIRKAFKDGGYLKTSDNVDRGGVFLVGYRGCLFTVESDFQVAETYKDYAAVGCADMLALGALYGLQNSTQSPKNKLKTALRAASEHSAGVMGPFVIKKV